MLATSGLDQDSETNQINLRRSKTDIMASPENLRRTEQNQQEIDEEQLEQQSIVILDAVISSNSKKDRVQRDSLFSSSKSGSGLIRETLSMIISSQTQ